MSTASQWRLLWKHGDPENDSYDCNSGLSFDIVLFYINTKGEIGYFVVSLCKPQIYGLWHCLWNNHSDYRQLLLDTHQATGIIMVQRANENKIELGILPLDDFFPFRTVFPSYIPHCLCREEYNEIVHHIQNSVIVMTERQRGFMESTFCETFAFIDDVLDTVFDVVSLNEEQRRTVYKTIANKMIIKTIESWDEYMPE